MSDFPHPTYSTTVLIPAYDDAQLYLFEHMLAAHEAHAIMLVECDIITAENASAIVTAVAEIRARGVEAYAYQPGVEDLFFRIESQIIKLAGADFGGNLQLARSRNDLGQALARMALREQVLMLHADFLVLRRSIIDLARKHLNTLMPGYTHTQPAQPVTFAHYLAAILTFLDKDQARLAATYANVNESPLGAAAFTGSGFPIDRERVANLLGFDSVIASTHYSIGAGDHLTDIAFAIQSAAINLGRVTKDLLFFATRESNALRIDDGFIQISSIMPQKRNPVVLEHLRARLSRALGYAQTITIQCHSIPFGDTQDIEDEILPPTINAINALHECLILYASVFDTLELNKEHLRNRAAEGFTTATELADVLVRDLELPFRLAHKVVATAVKSAFARGTADAQIEMADLQAAAQETVGHELPISEEQLQRALDPQNFVDVRNGLGGVSAESTAALINHQEFELATDQAWYGEAQANQTLTEDIRYALIYELIGR